MTKLTSVTLPAKVEAAEYNWAVIQIRNETHIIPVSDKDGEVIIPPHFLSKQCYCQPYLERSEDGEQAIVDHNTIH